MLCLTSCNRNKFHIVGNITNAKDTTLYFEAVGLGGLETLDSVKLDAKGAFAFAGKAGKSPEFYRLRIGADIINLSIDSTETVTVKASLENMPLGYKVEGSDNCTKIRELSLMQMRLQDEVLAIERNPDMGDEAQNAAIKRVVEAFKNKVRNDYVFREPNKAYAYYAVFQTLGNYLIFDPLNDKNDVKTYAAVATAWDLFYPGTPRAENLHNIVIEGMKQTRKEQALENQTIDASKVTVAGVIPISLPDIEGRTRNLTDLKGKVVMLDFTQYAMKDSPQRIMQLRSIYNKFASRGFVIYQVSLDDNEHFWKTSCQSLPWICVRDEEGSASEIATRYRVTVLPEYFLINRNNELVARSSDIPDLQKGIEKLLAQK